MKEEDRIFIEHILESIALIESYVEQFTKEKFLLSREKQDAVIRRLEIIGEAVKNISSDLKQKCPNIPWREIAGMRDMLIHKYFGVDLKLTWKTVQKDLPILKRELLNLLKMTKNQD